MQSVLNVVLVERYVSSVGTHDDLCPMSVVVFACVSLTSAHEVVFASTIIASAFSKSSDDSR